MTKFAQIDNNGIVVGMVDSSSPDIDLHPSLIAATANVLGMLWTGSDFVTPPDTTYIHFVFPITAQTHTDIVVNVEVKNANGDLVQVTSTYYVPIVRSADGIQVSFEAVSFTNGSATVVFQVSEPGQYVMLTDKIVPKPTALILSEPSIIVLS